MGIFPIDVNFLHHVELNTKLGGYKFNLLGFVMLLSSELIARERNYLKAFVAEFLMQQN